MEAVQNFWTFVLCGFALIALGIWFVVDVFTHISRGEKLAVSTICLILFSTGVFLLGSAFSPATLR